MEFSIQNVAGQVTIALVGDLDEDFAIQKFEKLLEEGKSSGKPCRILLREVDSGNSTGISLFLQAVKAHALPVRYAEVPHWILIQMHFFRDFILPNVLVESILAECIPEGATDSVPLVLELGKDIPILEHYPDAPMRVFRDGMSYTACLEADDLGFVSYHIHRFRTLEP